jgi:hypothetical protein
MATTSAPDNPGANKTCFAHYHLTPEEYGLWTHARQLSHESAIFYFDGRKIANRFAKTGKNTIYRIGNNLIRKGWFVIVRKSKRLKNGMFSPGQYRPASHEEWAAKHRGECTGLEIDTTIDSTSPGIGTGEDGTSPGIGNDLSQNQERPVLEPGHNIKGLNIKGECKGEPTHTPVLDSNQHAEDEEEIDPSPASHPVQVLETSVGEYGTPGWLKTTTASMSDEDILLADFGMIDISGGRTIQSNPRLRTAIREQLARKVPIREILSAVANHKFEDGDRHPGLTLADNLGPIMLKWTFRKIDEAKESKRRELAAEEARLDREKTFNEQAARKRDQEDEDTALQERSNWRSDHGDLKAFVSSNPSALCRADQSDRW